MATDVRQVMIDVLAEHSRRTDPNHPAWPKCHCGFDPEAPTEGDTWAEHAADESLKALRDAGIDGFIDRNATLVPRVYTDDDFEVWVDGDEPT